MEELRQWILTLTGTAALSAVAQAIAPEGAVKRAVRLACGLGVLAAMLSVSMDFDWDRYAAALRQHGQQGTAYAQAGEIQAMEDTRAYIEAAAEAYISTAAGELGCSVTAEVTAEWSGDGCWYPYRAVLTAACDEAQRQTLTDTLERELGIPAERQSWNTEDADETG